MIFAESSFRASVSNDSCISGSPRTAPFIICGADGAIAHDRVTMRWGLKSVRKLLTKGVWGLTCMPMSPPHKGQGVKRDSCG